ncbi:MAG: PorT family protein [Prevotellaceae bacterium]|nr:PorT family protein [Prevotellaceae bacterium]
MAFTLGLNAQLRFGAKIGGAVSSLSTKNWEGEKEDRYKARLGFLLGGMMEYSFTESFALQPELLYVLNGAKEKEGGDGGRISLHNIQLPVNLKYKFGVEGLKFYATAGPYFSLIAGAKVKEGDKTRDLFKEDGGIIKRMDFGLGVGFGVEIKKIAIGAGYSFGLSNLYKKSSNSEDNGEDKNSMKTGTFALSVGYFF